jgi:hypothetical protein
MDDKHKERIAYDADTYEPLDCVRVDRVKEAAADLMYHSYEAGRIMHAMQVEMAMFGLSDRWRELHRGQRAHDEMADKILRDLLGEKERMTSNANSTDTSDCVRVDPWSYPRLDPTPSPGGELSVRAWLRGIARGVAWGRRRLHSR